MDIGVIINQMVQLFLVIGVGYILNKLDIFDTLLNKKLSTLLLSVTTPCLILSSVITSSDYAPMNEVVVMLLITIAMYTLLPIFSFFLVKLLRIPKEKQGLYMFMTVFSNVGFMGFPVIESIFGSEAIFYAAIINMGFNLMIYSVGVLMMNYGTKRHTRIELKSLLSPGVIASLLAFFFYLTRISVPSVIGDTVALIGSITTPIAMLLIGSTLATIPVKEIFSDFIIYPYTFIKQILLPVVAFPLLSYFVKDTYILGISFIILAMPIANSAVLFSIEYDGDVDTASKSVFLTTLVSVITIPLLVYFYLL
ncbi:AEC family transporter [Tannockella kyphosi]|uniref:AEC family transporter n=1 Tax=Tannockella kyphosi TaxID=2899121 RepID=UPI002012ADE0|nr:AEC family transporter [Tannockella kyphosi]